MSHATIGSLLVHDCTQIRAAAVKTEQSSWLELTLDHQRDLHISIFMPFERANRLADAINAAEDEECS